VVSLNVDPDAVIRRQQVGTIPRSTDEAAAHILSLINSPGTRDEMAKRSRQYVANTHSEIVVAEAFERAVLTGNRRHRLRVNSQTLTRDNSQSPLEG
jgi:hypothetical protein